ncbi:hypothetical protein D770_24845 [Flammeovirgaceae bacterium 311]|nr:hypothetical protein D770_24845 [Flammeovirgaceae bacterium 311]
MKNIIALKILRDFYEKYPDSEPSLLYWIQATKRAEWNKPSDVIADFPTADIIKNDRVIFNISGNKYRLVVSINYTTKYVYIRFIGTHKQYDSIDVHTI